MIHYALRCGGAHEFDGWFASSAAFERQATGGLLACPLCGDARVERALMAPRLGGHALSPEPEPVPRAEGASSVVAPPMPDAVRAMLARIRSEVERRCEHVGSRFAEEARAIHEDRAPERPIYGQATADEVAALADDGIETMRVPWVKLSDA